MATRLVQQRRVLGYHGSAEFYAHARRLTRWVYILLYPLAGVRLSLYLFEIVATSFNPHVHNSVSRVRLLGDFQIYIAYGVIPLWVIRPFFLGSKIKVVPCLRTRLRARLPRRFRTRFVKDRHET